MQGIVAGPRMHLRQRLNVRRWWRHLLIGYQQGRDRLGKSSTDPLLAGRCGSLWVADKRQRGPASMRPRPMNL